MSAKRNEIPWLRGEIFSLDIYCVIILIVETTLTLSPSLLALAALVIIIVARWVVCRHHTYNVPIHLEMKTSRIKITQLNVYFEGELC
jgi:hypothetical protein